MQIFLQEKMNFLHFSSIMLEDFMQILENFMWI